MKTKEITITGLLIAILIVMTIVPNFGMIQVGVVAITLMHIPVIIGALTLGVVPATIIGLAFGVASWLIAVMRAATPIDLLFVNPLVAINPRVLFALFTALLWKLMNNHSKRYGATKATFTALLGTAFHTFAVALTIWIAIKSGMDQTLVGLITSGFWNYLLLFMTGNALLEMVIAVVISVPVLRALGYIGKRSAEVHTVAQPLIFFNNLVSLIFIAFGLLFSPYFLLLPATANLLGFLVNENPVMVIGDALLKTDEQHTRQLDLRKQRSIAGLVALSLIVSMLLMIAGWKTPGLIVGIVAILMVLVSFLSK